MRLFPPALVALASLATAACLPTPGTREALLLEARELRPFVHSELARSFLSATERLPRIATRTLFHDPKTGRWLAKSEAAHLPSVERARLRERRFDEAYYYEQRYGTPLAYARPLDLLGHVGFGGLAGKRILDFGFGGIGQLRLFASLGADAVGVDVNPLHHALYSPDVGPVAATNGASGRVTLVLGRFPTDAPVRAAVGAGFDLFIAKNVLKRGYIHPERPAPERQLIRLGVSDEDFLRAVHAALKPGGRFLIFNICPAPSPPGKPYIPWADGRSPFPRALFEKVGFRVRVLDRDDTAAVRDMAHRLGWDRGDEPFDIHNDLFAWYTLVEKP